MQQYNNIASLIISIFRQPLITSSVCPHVKEDIVLDSGQEDVVMEKDCTGNSKVVKQLKSFDAVYHLKF